MCMRGRRNFRNFRVSKALPQRILFQYPLEGYAKDAKETKNKTGYITKENHKTDVISDLCLALPKKLDLFFLRVLCVLRGEAVMNEIIAHLTDTIRDAAAHRTPLCIRGGGSKNFYGGVPRGEALSVSAYRGIIDYDPSELVITARAGTPLADVEAALNERAQMLVFEPPHFDQLPSPLAPLPQGREGNVVAATPQRRMATLGGCIAAGLSGPRRAYAGAARDTVLGARMLDGRGDDLRFGGQVMKNVAGFDVSRVLAGSLGTLGVMLEISLKVLPVPVAEATLCFEHTVADAIALMNEWAGRPLPLSATAWADGRLYVRLSGASAAVAAAIKTLGGEQLGDADARRHWQDIREHTAAFFAPTKPLWRLSIKSTTPPLNLAGAQLLEWNGALRWLATDTDANTVREAAKFGGGHATLFRGGDKTAGVFHPLPPALMTIHRNLKRTFDPARIFNPGRLYPDL
jgi:glycolate oxidase FAD binding subunit